MEENREEVAAMEARVSRLTSELLEQGEAALASRIAVTPAHAKSPQIPVTPAPTSEVRSEEIVEAMEARFQRLRTQVQLEELQRRAMQAEMKELETNLERRAAEGFPVQEAFSEQREPSNRERHGQAPSFKVENTTVEKTKPTAENVGLEVENTRVTLTKEQSSTQRDSLTGSEERSDTRGPDRSEAPATTSKSVPYSDPLATEVKKLGGADSGTDANVASGTGITQQSGTGILQQSGTNTDVTFGTNAGPYSGTNTDVASGTGILQKSGTNANADSGTGAVPFSGTYLASSAGPGEVDATDQAKSTQLDSQDSRPLGSASGAAQQFGAAESQRLQSGGSDEQQIGTAEVQRLQSDGSSVLGMAMSDAFGPLLIQRQAPGQGTPLGSVAPDALPPRYVPEYAHAHATAEQSQQDARRSTEAMQRRWDEQLAQHELRRQEERDRLRAVDDARRELEASMGAEMRELRTELMRMEAAEINRRAADELSEQRLQRAREAAWREEVAEAVAENDSRAQKFAISTPGSKAKQDPDPDPGDDDGDGSDEDEDESEEYEDDEPQGPTDAGAPNADDVLGALSASFGQLAQALQGGKSQLHPSEARQLDRIQVNWEKLTTGKSSERLRYARGLADEIVTIAGTILPAPVDVAEDADADAAPEEPLGTKLARAWTAQGLKDGQAWAKAFRKGLTYVPTARKRQHRLEGPLDTCMYNRLAHKLTPTLQAEVRGGNDADDEFELPSYGATSLACTQGVIYLIYRSALPSTKDDEEAMEQELKNPVKPKTASGTVAALRALGESVRLAARCGIEPTQYAYLGTAVRGLLKEAEGVEKEEKGDDLREDRRALEREFEVMTLEKGSEARKSFLSYLTKLAEAVARHIRQDTGANEKAKERGAGRRALAKARKAAAKEGSRRRRRRRRRLRRSLCSPNPRRYRRRSHRRRRASRRAW